MTTNVWIERVMKIVPTFMGVYSADNILLPAKFPSSCIVNLSTQYEKGTHFVSILYPNSETCIYFDPLDLGYIPKNIFDYLRKQLNRNIIIINFQIQNMFSIFCGLYCMLLSLLQLHKYPIYDTIQQNFKEGSELNDDKCIRMLRRLIILTHFTHDTNVVFDEGLEKRK